MRKFVGAAILANLYLAFLDFAVKIHLRPQKTFYALAIETFNDMTVLFSSYMVFYFAD